jgi:hypothetical protein
VFNPLDPPFMGDRKKGIEGHPQTPGRRESPAPLFFDEK